MSAFSEEPQPNNISSDSMPLCYVEHDFSYSEVPKWVYSMINFGYSWKKDISGKERKIALITTPCKSPAAALITLGVLRYDLERPDASLAVGYFEYLKERLREIVNSKQDVYLIDEYCHKWIFSTIEGENFIRVLDANYKKYTTRKGKKIENLNGRPESLIGSHNATKWRLESEPMVESKNQLDSTIYNLIVSGAGKLVERNLKSSWLDTLYVGKASGSDTAYWNYLHKISLNARGIEASLIDLLTVAPDVNSISRIKYCSMANVGELNHGCGLVIADGVKEFMKSIDSQKESDVIGVISRDENPDTIQSLATKLAEMNRYYVPFEDEKLLSEFSPAIAGKLFKRR